MKQCPSCKSTYTDETLRYCLADGAALAEIDTDEPTVVATVRNVAADTELLPARENVRIEIPPEQDRVSAERPVSAKSSGNFLKAFLVVAVFAILAAGIAGVAGLLYYNSTRGETVANNARVSTPTPTPDQTGQLRDQIANLEKRLNEQNNASRPVSTPTPSSEPIGRTARVNSPSDGFLALRTLPNSETGERVLKIPHGATISVGECGQMVTPVKRSGRWCRASYDGQSGWVFDAYLIYSRSAE
ncbi:MAG: hypothetical protein WBO10_09550 [Pyrinomonadaceae bacterium]